MNGDTPLHVAMRSGNDAAAETLLGWGADPNAQNVAGDAATHIAAAHGNLGVRVKGTCSLSSSSHSLPPH